MNFARDSPHERQMFVDHLVGDRFLLAAVRKAEGLLLFALRFHLSSLPRSLAPRAPGEGVEHLADWS